MKNIHLKIYLNSFWERSAWSTPDGVIVSIPGPVFARATRDLRQFWQDITSRRMRKSGHFSNYIQFLTIFLNGFDPLNSI